MSPKQRMGQALRKVDMFKSPVNLLYEKQEYGSPCGGFMSLVLIILLVVIFLPTFQTFFSFQNYSVQISEFNVSPQPLTTFDNRTFSLAVLLYGYNGTKKSHDVYFTQNEIIIDSTGAQIQNRTTRYLGVPCNTSFWQATYGKKVAQSLKLYEQKESKLICNPPQFNMSIQGRYSNNMTAFFVSIQRCHSEDCLTDQQIIDEKVSYFYPQVFFPQTTFNYYNSTPIQLFLQEEFWYFSKSSPLTKRAYELLLSDVIIDDSDADIWPTAITFLHNASNIKKGFLIDMFYQTDELLNDDILAFWRFRKSPKTIVATRSIDKIDDLISYIGGCLGVLLVIGEILRAYNYKLMLLQLGGYIKFQPEGKSQQPIYKTFSFMDFVELSIKQLFDHGFRSPQELNYIEKAQYIIDHSEKMLSVNRLYKRLRKCEILLQCMAGEHSLNLVTLHNEKAVNLDKEEELATLVEQMSSGKVNEGPPVQNLPLHIFQNVRDTIKHELFKRNNMPTSFAEFSKTEEKMEQDLNLIFKGFALQIP